MAYIQIGNQTITAAKITLMLAGFQMLPQLCRLLIIERAIAPIELTKEESISAIEQYQHKNQLTTPEAIASILKHYGMSEAQLETVATREIKIEKFKQATWGHKRN